MRVRALRKRPKICHLIVTDLSASILLKNQLLYFQDKGLETHVIAAEGPHTAAVVRAGITYHRVDFTRAITPGRDLRALAQVTRILREQEYDLVHLHLPKPVLLGTIASFLTSVPHVFRTIHGFYFHSNSNPMIAAFFVNLERMVNPFHEVVLSQNREDIPTAQARRIRPSHHIVHLGNGIDLRRFDPDRTHPQQLALRRRALGIEPHDRVIGFVGRFVREKGLPELCEAFWRLARHDPSLRLLLVGEEVLRSSDRLDVASCLPPDLRPRVIRAGWQERVEDFYPLMDVFALPSYREGFPRCAMEASAMGIPAVATNIRGCREAVAHNENGLLVPLGSVPALQTALQTVLENPLMATRLALGGRLKALREFDERAKFEMVFREYARVLGLPPLFGSVNSNKAPGSQVVAA